MTPPLRAWQTAFPAAHAATAAPDFLLVATPGTGKSLARASTPGG